MIKSRRLFIYQNLGLIRIDWYLFSFLLLHCLYFVEVSTVGLDVDCKEA